jgi:hypothetical protein
LRRPAIDTGFTVPVFLTFLRSSIGTQKNRLYFPAKNKFFFNISVQEKLARRYVVFCTFDDDEMFNPIPSSEQTKKADYFFHRGYDPASEEVVALDEVVDELGGILS